MRGFHLLYKAEVIHKNGPWKGLFVVIWSQPVSADLRSIHDFIARDSRFYAKKVVQDIRILIVEYGNTGA